MVKHTGLSYSKQPQNPDSSKSNVTSRTLWQSYKALPARTRLYFSLGVCAVALTGIAVSELLEQNIPPVNHISDSSKPRDSPSRPPDHDSKY